MRAPGAIVRRYVLLARFDLRRAGEGALDPHTQLLPLHAFARGGAEVFEITGADVAVGADRGADAAVQGAAERRGLQPRHVGEELAVMHHTILVK